MTGPAGGEGDPRVFGDIGTNVVFEDDTVRVWRLKLAPGEESAVHRHELDHLLIQVSGDRIAVVPEPDSEGPFREMLEADVVPGAVVHVHRGGVEVARNIGSQPYLEVIVELKGPETGAGSD
jgi:hypothetical protein